MVSLIDNKEDRERLQKAAEGARATLDKFAEKKRKDREKDKSKGGGGVPDNRPKFPQEEREIEKPRGEPKKQQDGMRFNFRGHNVTKEEFDVLSGKGGRLTPRVKAIQAAVEAAGGGGFTEEQKRTFGGEGARNLAELSQLEETESERFLEQVQVEGDLLDPSNTLGLFEANKDPLTSKILKKLGFSKEAIAGLGVVSLFGIPPPVYLESTVKSNTEEFLDEQINTKTVTGLKVVGDVDVFGASTENIVDALTDRQKVKELQSALGKYGTIASTLEGIKNKGGDSTAKSVARLQNLDKELSTMENKMQQALIDNPVIASEGAFEDVMADLLDQRTSIEEAITGVLATEPAFEPVQIQQLKDQLIKDVRG